jgi:hypothetical protein
VFPVKYEPNFKYFFMDVSVLRVNVRSEKNGVQNHVVRNLEWGLFCSNTMDQEG